MMFSYDDGLDQVLLPRGLANRWANVKSPFLDDTRV